MAYIYADRDVLIIQMEHHLNISQPIFMYITSVKDVCAKLNRLDRRVFVIVQGLYTPLSAKSRDMAEVVPVAKRERLNPAQGDPLVKGGSDTSDTISCGM
jgi:hypothetical protein